MFLCDFMAIEVKMLQTPISDVSIMLNFVVKAAWEEFAVGASIACGYILLTRLWIEPKWLKYIK